MTDREFGQLSQKVLDTSDDVAEIKADLKALIDRLDSKYYTRREGRAVSIFLGLLMTLMTFWDSVKAHVK